MQPIIRLFPKVSYDLGGNIMLSGTVTAVSALDDTVTTTPLTVYVAQPETWTTDEQVLDAVAALFPKAHVEWYPKQD